LDARWNGVASRRVIRRNRNQRKPGRTPPGRLSIVGSRSRFFCFSQLEVVLRKSLAACPKLSGACYLRTVKAPNDFWYSPSELHRRAGGTFLSRSGSAHRELGTQEKGPRNRHLLYVNAACRRPRNQITKRNRRPTRTSKAIPSNLSNGLTKLQPSRSAKL
jgi:hypothetical protein